MKFFKPAFIITLYLCFSVSESHAQKAHFKSLKLDRDTLDQSVASSMKKEFKKEFEGRGKKKVTNTVTFDVATLKDIIDSCTKLGVDKIKFQFAILRQEDVARYVKNHPNQNLSQDDINDLVGRPTLLIQVPRKLISENAGMSDAGAVDENPAQAAAAAASNAGYIEAGSICPPPASCDEM